MCTNRSEVLVCSMLSTSTLFGLRNMSGGTTTQHDQIMNILMMLCMTRRCPTPQMMDMLMAQQLQALQHSKKTPSIIFHVHGC